MAQIIEEYAYTLTQQIYSLSTAANAVGYLLYSYPEDELQKKMEEVLPRKLEDLSGGWEVTWGPKVYKARAADHGPTNVWFAAESKEQKVCVIAIAGTARGSQATWDTINLDVSNVVDFEKWCNGWKDVIDTSNNIPVPKGDQPDDGKPFCSRGTCTGVSNLLNLMPPASGSAKEPNTRLHKYLRKVSAGYKIIFTGHSMGGALSPALACGLVKSGVVDFKDKPVSVMASAGASPGNAKFAALCANLGGNVYNPLDVVPMAWGLSSPADQNLDNILGKIYKDTKGGFKGSARDYLEEKVPENKKRAQDSKMNYVPIKGQQLPDARLRKVPILAIPGLADEAFYQHVTFYKEKWGIKGWVNSFKRSLAEAVGEPWQDEDELPLEEEAEGEGEGEMRPEGIIDGSPWPCSIM